MKQIPAAAFILAGGRSSRFGSNKAMALWNNRPLAEHLSGKLKEIFETAAVVSKNPREYSFLSRLGIENVEDTLAAGHPLSGVHAGLNHSRYQYNFFTACDMPFLNEGVIASLWDLYSRTDSQACVGRWRGRIEPLLGFYSKDCAAQARRCVKAGASALDFLTGIKCAVLETDEIAVLDPLGLSFLDLDTRNDYEEALGHAH